jgi:hypothetical protein
MPLTEIEKVRIAARRTAFRLASMLGLEVSNMPYMDRRDGLIPSGTRVRNIVSTQECYSVKVAKVFQEELTAEGLDMPDTQLRRFAATIHVLLDGKHKGTIDDFADRISSKFFGIIRGHVACKKQDPAHLHA